MTWLGLASFVIGQLVVVFKLTWKESLAFTPRPIPHNDFYTALPLCTALRRGRAVPVDAGAFNKD